jgi:NAD dependent epimerase/dehydratase family enzyme
MGTAPELVLKSRKVVSATLAEAGYSFKFPDLAQAIRNLEA